MLKHSILSALLVGTLLLPQAWAADAPRASQVEKQSLKAIELRGQAQKVRESHQETSSNLLDQIEAARKEFEQLSAHLKKTKAYVDNQQAKLSETERRIVEAEKIKLELTPLLDRTLADLAEGDSGLPPWDAEAYKARTEDITKVLDDYDARLSSKALAVLNELRLRVQQASRPQVVEEELTIDGRITRVQLLRLGGLGWYALSADGGQAWLWDYGSDKFTPMEGFSEQLGQAIEIVQRHRVVNLIELPMAKRPAPVNTQTNTGTAEAPDAMRVSLNTTETDEAVSHD